MLQDTFHGSGDGLSRSKTAKPYRVVDWHRFIDTEPSGNACSLPYRKEALLMNGLVFPVE